MRRPPPPLSSDELLHRARLLDGLTVGELARRLAVELADDPRRTKGKVGELVELALGAEAGNLDLPDFPHLGIELKTIPLDPGGKVRESTYVCALELAAVEREEWRASRVRRKLDQVLWFPVEASGRAPLHERHLGSPTLWRLAGEDEALLEADYNELVGRIAIGGVEEITAHLGEALQIRPKAASAAVRVAAWGPEGEALQTVPLGFYLRARFTERLLWAAAPGG